MGTSTAPQTTDNSSQPPKAPALRIVEGSPHRAFTAEELVKTLTPAIAKDPEKHKAAVDQMAADLAGLTKAGLLADLGSGQFKARLFFDKEEQNIEHAFLGGMGNTFYRFRSPLFRLNIGVLSLFFIRDAKGGTWRVTVRDTTIGRDYSLTKCLSDGTYIFGSRAPGAGESNFLSIEGKYINKEHMTLTLSGEEVHVEDHQTINGTRVDALTPQGLTQYRELANAFLQAADPKEHQNGVARGRFTLDTFVKTHKNYENSFFNAMVDSLLMAGGQPAARG